MDLPLDIWIIIIDYLSNRDKTQIRLVSREMNTCVLYFDECVDIAKIKNLSYFDKFRNVLYDGYSILPKNVKRIKFYNNFNGDVMGKIPNGVTHLTFGARFDRDIKGAIPNTVRYLTFGWDFNQDIMGAIPDSVIYLAFGWNFNQDITGAIPDSVKKLKMRKYLFKKFKKYIKGKKQTN